MRPLNPTPATGVCRAPPSTPTHLPPNLPRTTDEAGGTRRSKTKTDVDTTKFFGGQLRINLRFCL